MTNEEQIKDYRTLRSNGKAFFIDNYEDADRIIEALEKQIAKPVEVYSDGDADGYPVWEEHCPCCGYDFDGTTPNFCPDCGQRLLFEEESE